MVDGVAAGGWRPLRVLGAPGGAGGAGTHRLPVWPDLPAVDGADAAIVIGQPDLRSEGPQAGGRGPRRVLGWSRPPAMIAETVAVEGVSAAQAADVVLGQVNFDRAGENRWTAVAPDTRCWPYGLSAATDDRYGELLAIADSGNNRVMLWQLPLGRP